jgi:hypothetical protein
MKRHKKLIVALLGMAALAIILSITLSAGAAPSVSPAPAQAAMASATPAAATAPVETAQSAAAPAIPTVIMSADFSVVYSTLTQLSHAADIIVRGEIVDISYLDFDSTAYTRVTLEVSRCLKGDLAAGAQITIVEVGGITSLATIKGDKFGTPTQQDADTKVSVQLEGAPLAQVGDKCVYFLGTGSIGVVPGTYYVPLGAFQGRFNIANGLAKRFVPSDWQGNRYTSLSIADTTFDQKVSTADPTLDQTALPAASE